MAKNPKKLNPIDPLIKTWPGQNLNTGVVPATVDLLPGSFRTDTNKKVISAIMEDLFQPASLETLNFLVGRNTSRSKDNNFLPHPTARRQLEAGLVVYTNDGVETLSADDVAKGWEFDNRENELPVPLGILNLPIDPDKFVNWSDYYWIEEGMPPVNVTGGTQAQYYDIGSDIVGSRYYTLPVQRNGRSLELKNGIRLIFQQHPFQTSIAADERISYVSTGATADSLHFELLGYDKQLISISVNGNQQVQGTDYNIYGNEIQWIVKPTAGDNIHVFLLDYYLTRDDYKQMRVWQVEGVGSEEGIRLLGRSHQITNTVYSKITQGRWDQTAIPWDRIEWDGDILGINAKHYVLQKVGAENRNAHSRVNVWYHKDTIQALASFLDIPFDDIAKPSSNGLRPILEFDHRLELWNHGKTYRPWVNGVESIMLSPNSYVGMPLKEFSIIQKLANEDTLDYQLNTAPRILWLTTNSSVVNNIINFISEDGVITGYFVETANHDDAVVVANPFYVSGLSYSEYYWLSTGEATLANYRKSRTTNPLFELYSRDGIKLSDPASTTNGSRPSIVNSTILQLPSTGDTVDNESGYKLKFLTSQFNQLSEGNIAKNAMYDISYEYTQQTHAIYFSAGAQLTVPGPYSYRIVQGKPLEYELSNGWKKAWFRLKSWAIRCIDITGDTVVPLDITMWPTYNWGISPITGQAKFIHLDDFEPVVENRAVVARNELATFNMYFPLVSSVIVNFGSTEVELDVVNGKLEFVVPSTASDICTISWPDNKLTFRVIEAYQDPRNVKVKINGLPAEYEFDVVRDGTDILSVSLVVSGTGTIDIMHQGNSVETDSLTAIPGFDLNADQLVSFGSNSFTDSISVARLVGGLHAQINATKRKDQSWIDCMAIGGMNGILMAQHSSIRAAWATFKLNPSLDKLLIARSMSSWRWYRRFINKLEESLTILDLDNTTVASALDRILEELLLGTNYSSTDAVTGMAFTTNGMLPTEYAVTVSQSRFAMASPLQTGISGTDHVYFYLNGQLLKNTFDYTFDTVSNEVVLKTPAPVGSTVIIFQANEEDVFTAIPASPAKLGLSGVFEPKLVTESWGDETRTFIQRHDGSRITAYMPPDESAFEDYVLNKIILEFETRVFNGIIKTVGDIGTQLQVNNFKNKDPLESVAKAQLEWYSANTINFRDRSDFKLTDPWTWNYGGYSWRGIYLNYFGTYNLNTAPWESLGYSIMPAWWNSYYSWTDTVKRVNLEFALQHGITSSPADALTVNPAFARKVDSFPVDANGKLLDPVTWGIATPTADEAEQPWEIGSWGTAETAWRRSIAGAWGGVLHAVDDYAYLSEFFDNSVDPFSIQLQFDNDSVKPKGYNSISPSQFFQDRPTVGIGAVIFEANREFNLIGETPLIDLMSINIRVGFGIGGFSDSEFTLKMPFTKFQTGSYVPVEDTLMTLSEGVALPALRYTAVRVEKDNEGFRVYGFDPGQRHFTILQPSVRSTTGNFPSTRQQVVTNYGTFIEYLEWDQTEIVAPYGQFIANKQDLLTFLMGLGEFQASKGLILDQINDRGIITTWKQAAIDAFAWIEENWGTHHYCVIGVATNDGLKFYHERGMLDRLDSELGHSGKILFNSGRSALASEILITRNYEPNVDKISPASNEQIVFADIRLREYEHVVYINRRTKFNDTIVDFQTGARLDSLKLSGRRSYAWTGRPNARGLIPNETGIIPSFDAIVSDIIESHKPESSAFDGFKSRVSRANSVPSKDSVVFDIIQDPNAAFLYRQGLQTSSGTNLAIDALFRNVNFDIPGRLQDVSVNEQWMFDTGNYGRVGEQKIWEIELRKEDFTGSRQIIRFKEDSTVVDLRGDNIIDIIGTTDPRWVTQPTDSVEFRTIPRSNITIEYGKQNGWLPSAGIAELADTDLKIVTLDDFNYDNLLGLTDIASNVTNTLTKGKLFATRSFSKYGDYEVGDYTWYAGILYKSIEKYQGSDIGAFDPRMWESVPVTGNLLPSAWISDYNGKGWNVLQVLAPMYVEEVCPNALEQSLNESKATFASPHGLIAGEKIIFGGCGDGAYDNVHVVKEVVDDYNILIAARSTSDQVVYDMVAYRLVEVKFNSDSEWQQSGISFSAGMKAYIDYGDTEGTWKIVSYVADGTSTPAIVTEYSGPMVASGDITTVQLTDYYTRTVVSDLEVFDPYKGLTIDQVAVHVDYKGIVDPATYNVTDLGTIDEYAVESWGANAVGKLWWDLTKLRYIEYEQTDDIQYRASHWGEKFANTKAVVYEWTGTDKLPNTIDYPFARLDTSSGLQGQVRYSEQEEYDFVTGGTNTRYYFWNGNIDTVPAGISRPPANAIESILNDPDANGVAWMSPIDNNAFVISNINDFFNNTDKLVLRIEQNTNVDQIYNFSKIITEGFTGNVINDYFYNRLESSVAGRDNYKELYIIKPYVAGQSYTKGDYIVNFDNGYFKAVTTPGVYGTNEFPLLAGVTDRREDIKQVWTAKDGRDHKIFLAAKDFVASGTVAEERTSRVMVRSAATALITNILEILSPEYYAVVNNRRAVPSKKLHPLRRYGNKYFPYPQSWFSNLTDARRTLVVAANNFLLQIDTVSKANWDFYLRTYRPLYGKYSRDISRFWKYVDYVVDGYAAGSEANRLTSFIQVQDLDSAATNFAIVDNANNTIEAYNRNGTTIELVYRKNGTIQFLDAIWDGSLGDAWDRSRFDRTPWDEDGSEIAECILRALRLNIFTAADEGYFNLLFFAMVKESLVQVPFADWVSKTTYLDVGQTSSNSLLKVGTFFNKNDSTIKKYLNEVKPYHSKIVDTNQYSKSSFAFDVKLDESVKLNITTVTLITTEGEDLLQTETNQGLAYRFDTVTQSLTDEG